MGFKLWWLHVEQSEILALIFRNGTEDVHDDSVVVQTMTVLVIYWMMLHVEKSVGISETTFVL